MTETPTSPVLDAVVRVAMGATGATRGRVLTADAGTGALSVVAGLGGDVTWRSAAPGPQDLGLVGAVVATGHPQVLTSQAGQGGAPRSALCAPCLRDDEVVGALELADKAGPAGFSIDDMEMASLFAGVAGAAIIARRAPRPADPDQLTADLVRLAAADPARYATVARLVQSLLYV